MRTVRIGLVGCGTVGGGVVRILNEHAADFERHHGVRVEIAKATSRTRSKMEALGIPADRIVDSYKDIVADPEIDMVVELIGGTGIAADVIIDSLRAGKHVVTANKAVMASRGAEVFAAAESTGAEVAYDGSVGGGIPIIQPLKRSLTGNHIDTVLGIVNGTTNYMLTRIGDGLTYDNALHEAQDKGFAEADPTADVDGLDAAAKIAILASIAFNSRVTMDQVPTEGIRSIEPSDLAFADSMGYAVKLLAIAHRGDKVDIRVHPTMIPKSHPLASVSGVFNAIFVHGDAVGDVMFYGEGAGSGPAASAVMGDIIEVARHITYDSPSVLGCGCVEELPIQDMGELVTQYYLRIRVHDRPGVLAQIAEELGREDVSIKSMLQEPARGDCADLIFMTHHAKEASIKRALENVKKLEDIVRIGTLIRIEED